MCSVHTHVRILVPTLPSTTHPLPYTHTHTCTERLMSQITEQVENGTLPNIAENLLNSSHLRKGAEPSQKATHDTQSLLNAPSDVARHKRILCSNSVGEDGKDTETNRKARANDQQCAVTGRTIKRHIAAVDEGMKSRSQTFPPLVNHVSKLPSSLVLRPLPLELAKYCVGILLTLWNRVTLCTYHVGL